jgi:capsular exopolysaccharide synthesis family protein
MEMNSGQNTNSRAFFALGLQDYVAMMVRGKWILLATFVLVLALAMLYNQFAERSYEATAAVKIDVKQLSSTLFHDATSGVVNANVMQNELEILKSNSLSELTAKKLLEKRYLDDQKQRMINIIKSDEKQTNDAVAPVEAVAARIRGDVDFEPVRESDVIKITGTSKDPAEAALIANACAQAYFDRNVYASRTKSRTFREFLQAQVKEKQGSLSKAEESLKDYMEKKGVVSLDDESRKIIEQLSQLEAQRDAVEISIQSLEKTISSYRDQVAQQEVSVAKVMGEANDPYISNMQAQLAQLEVQRDITVAQNPDFVGKEVYNARLNEIDGQIRELKGKLKKRTDDFLTNLLPSSESGGNQGDPAGYLRQIKQKMLQSSIELQAMQARKQALVQAISEYNRQFEHLPRKNMDFARLQREKMSSEKLYLAIEEKFNEANITEQAELGYVDIFDPATPATVPATPKVRRNLMLGGFAGLVLGFLLVLARERLNQRLWTPEEIRRRGFPLFTTIKNMEDEIKGLDGTWSGAGNGKKLNPKLLMLSNPLSPVAESYRHLRTSLLRFQNGAPFQTILVTSPEQGEGKTTTVSNLALAFAQAGKRVLLIDADLRRPTIASVFSVSPNPGLSEVIAKKAVLKDVLHGPLVEGLYVIPSGRIPSNPAESLYSEELRRLVAEAKQQYDYVLFDCPPVLAVTDASILSTMVDRVLLVVSAGNTSVGSLDRTIEILDGVGVKPSGLVLNNFNMRHAYGLTYYRTGYGDYGYATPYRATHAKPVRHQERGR